MWMSLTKSFFTNHNKQLQQLKEKGYIDIDQFECDYGISSTRLIDAGYLIEKELLSTGDLYEFRVSNKGKVFLEEKQNAQLILVKPGMAEILVKELVKSTNGLHIV